MAFTFLKKRLWGWFYLAILLFAIFPVILANPAKISLENGQGAFFGKLVDAETRQPIGWAQLYIEALNRSLTSHEDGTFHFYNVPKGDYILQIFRIGYPESAFSISIVDDDTTEIVLKLKQESISAHDVLVEANRSDVEVEPVISVSGKKLRQNLGRTIAETVDYEPGISQRSMGPAPARPVLRGLGGDRLMVLEDGSRTGDLSATSSDHAVAIEPMTAERIDVIRGPEAFRFGANVLAGVVNVARGYIPTHKTDRIHGSFTMHGESVNSGYSSAGNAIVPLGHFIARMDGSYRQASDISTPLGTLQNTGIETFNSSAGLSLVKNWGYSGASLGYYNSVYGIPPDAEGGHPGGVTIDLERLHTEAKAEIRANLPWIHRVNLHHSFTRYQHSEVEFSQSLNREITGTGFDVQTQNAEITLDLKQIGMFRNGVFGFWGEFRDHRTPTGRNLTPDAQEYSGAAFLYQEIPQGKWRFNSALRFDMRAVNPANEGDENAAGIIRQRNFSGFSGGLSAKYAPGSGFSFGTSMMRTYRAPGIEELFSEGPHLAVYNYEVGNANLDTEKGLGLEVFVDYKTSKAKFHLAAYRNVIEGYIFPQNTGMRSIRLYSLFQYQFVGENALLQGLEGSYEWRVLKNWEIGGTGSYVKAELSDLDQAIPRIPPLEGKLYLRYQKADFSLGAALRMADEQDRTGAFEASTDGYAVWDINAQYSFSAGRLLHTFSFSAQNIFDTEYRKHLNQIRHVMPEPGRNLKLLYKAFF